MEDEAAQAGRGMDAWIVGSLAVALASAIGFVAVAWTGGQTQWAGFCVFVAAGAAAVGLGLWARYFMPGEGEVEQRPAMASSEDDRRRFVQDFEHGEQVLGRRKLIGGLFGAGLLAALIGALMPLRGLGPNPGSALRRTAWRKGKRLVTPDGTPLKPSAIAPNSAVTVFPAGAVGSPDSQALLIRYGDVAFRPRPGRRGWNVAGCVAYSKICTHAGCPVGLYEAQSRRLLCPCHQSMFDVTDGARPVFGPATRSLPQLPLQLDQAGFLVAGGDFSGPVGPGSWHW